MRDRRTGAEHEERQYFAGYRGPASGIVDRDGLVFLIDSAVFNIQVTPTVPDLWQQVQVWKLHRSAIPTNAWIMIGGCRF
jgi:hypothetical protein